MERKQPLVVGPQELKEYLLKHGVDVESWGTGESKTLSHLLKEIHEGESVLELQKNGELHRIVTGVGVDVFYLDGSVLLKLEEEKQVFKDGRQRTRVLTASISEKMTANETPVEAAKRALREELKISDYDLSTDFVTKIKDPASSASFPGLQSRGVIYVYCCFIPSSEFKQEGYIEEQEDKTTYFIWKEVE